MKLAESGEMYLETILVLSKKSDRVHSVDVGEYMGFSKPSVSRAIGLLKRSGYVLMEPDGALVLTPEGKEKAESVYERHTLLTDFLIGLGVNAENAARDACKIEHDISQASFEAIKKRVRG